MNRVPRIFPALALMVLLPVGAASVAVITERGAPHVTSAALEKDAGIVIKRLPGGGVVVACGAESCARVDAVVPSGDTWVVPVAGLSKALHLRATFDEGGGRVVLSPEPGRVADAPGAPAIGSLVPNLRFTLLDGTSVSLDPLRGQRVLINSWASW